MATIHNLSQFRAAMSALLTRADLAAKLGQAFDGKRDYYEIFGYKKTPTFADFYARYRRDDLAARIIDTPAEATWQGKIKIQDEFESTEDSPFEKELTKLADRLRLFHHMERADKLAGIGHYAVLLIGVAGPANYEQPLTRISPADVLYVVPFSEDRAKIKAFVDNPRDPDYGKPLLYELTAGSIESGILRSAKKTFTVHKSRVIHVADGLLEDDVYGRPRLEKVFNRLDDLAKVVGGSAEVFWLISNRGLHVNVDKEMDLQPEDESKLTEEIEEYTHQLRRFIRTRGVDIKPLGAESPSPEPVFKMLISVISAATGIPQRILLGSEMGHLASSQDRANWAAKVASRQRSFAEPIMLRPFIDRLVDLGALPEPQKGRYEIEWPDALVLNENEKADRAAKVANASRSLNSQVIDVGEFREHYLELPHNLPKPATRAQGNRKLYAIEPNRDKK